MSAMNIDSPRFGTLDIEPARLIEFPRGLAGFEDCHRFSLFHPEGENPRYFILQSVDDPAAAFFIADPALFGFGYEIVLSDEECAELGLSDPALAAVVVMLVEDAADKPLRANLKAPLILNLETRRGLQHVFSNLDYNIAPLKEQP